MIRKGDKHKTKEIGMTYVPELINDTWKSRSECGWRHLSQLNGNLHSFTTVNAVK